MARRPEDGTGSGDGAPDRLDKPLLEALRKHFRHPYITGQGLEPPQGSDRQRTEQEGNGSDLSTQGPRAADPSDSDEQ